MDIVIRVNTNDTAALAAIARALEAGGDPEGLLKALNAIPGVTANGGGDGGP